MRIKAWDLAACCERDPATGEPRTYWIADLYTEPLWRHLTGRLLYWADERKPRWLRPSRRDILDRGDGAWSARWRLRFELWAGFGFHHKGRDVIETVRVADRDPGNWWKTDAPRPVARPDAASEARGPARSG